MPSGNELDSICGISDDELTERFDMAVRIANEIKLMIGVPIPCYDQKNGLAYLEYADGRREYVS